jgi:hypothetical protein
MAKKKPFIPQAFRTIITDGNYRILETRRGFYPQKEIRRPNGLTWYLKQIYRYEWVTLDVYGKPQDGYMYLECLTLKFDTLLEAKEALLEIASPSKTIHSWPA